MKSRLRISRILLNAPSTAASTPAPLPRQSGTRRVPASAQRPPQRPSAEQRLRADSGTRIVVRAAHENALIPVHHRQPAAPRDARLQEAFQGAARAAEAEPEV